MSREELINLALEQNAEIEALKMKLEKGKKKPSTNSSQFFAAALAGSEAESIER